MGLGAIIYKTCFNAHIMQTSQIQRGTAPALLAAMSRGAPLDATFYEMFLGKIMVKYTNGEI